MTDQNNTTKKSLSRRDVIKGGLAATALLGAGVLAGCSNDAPAQTDATATQAWDETADVVVVGSGAAGYAAAIEAANAGAKVLLLEKTSVVGGDSVLCDGILAGWGTRLAKAQGVDMTADDVYGWFMANPEWYGPKDPAVARVLAEESGKTIDWLEDIGVPFDTTVAGRFGYTELPVIHQVEGKGAAMIEVLASQADTVGVITTTDTKATKLLPNTEGRIIGIEAEQGGTPITIKANKGVVLTTGGYSASHTMLTALNAESVNLMPSSSPGVTGDGQVMAMEIGALTARMSTLPLMSSLAGLETGTINNINYAERLHGLWLDAAGERFYDESSPYNCPLGHTAIVRKQNEQGSPVVYLIGTTPELDALMSVYPLAWPTADSVEEVASMVGLDGAKVKATVDQYNEFCAAGKDDDFGRASEFLIPLEGPFYAAPITVSTSVSFGGLKTNEKAQALKLLLANDAGITEPIPGLYAAGVVCEWNTAAGCTVLSAMTQGRIAGQNAAQEAPAE